MTEAIHGSGELSDEELSRVTGGADPKTAPPAPKPAPTPGPILTSGSIDGESTTEPHDRTID